MVLALGNRQDSTWLSHRLSISKWSFCQNRYKQDSQSSATQLLAAIELLDSPLYENTLVPLLQRTTPINYTETLREKSALRRWRFWRYFIRIPRRPTVTITLVKSQHLLELLLWADVWSAATGLLTAVGCTWVKAGVALAADHLVAVVLLSQDTEGRLNDTTTETKDQVEGRLLLDVVVGKGAAVLQLLAGKDQTLLIWGDSFFVLNKS